MLIGDGADAVVTDLLPIDRPLVTIFFLPGQTLSLSPNRMVPEYKVAATVPSNTLCTIAAVPGVLFFAPFRNLFSVSRRIGPVYHFMRRDRVATFSPPKASIGTTCTRL